MGASVAKIANASRPVAVVVSTSPVSTFSPTTRFCRSPTRPTTGAASADAVELPRDQGVAAARDIQRT